MIKAHTYLIFLFTFLTFLIHCSTATTGKCQSTPAYTGLSASTATSLSHNSGLACLGCHGGYGGSAKTTFTAAGTLYTGAGALTPATTGTVTVAGIVLPVDTCGNFYTNAPVIFSGSNTKTANGTMISPVPAGFRYSGFSISGDCNMSGCHDGTSTTAGTDGAFIY